MLMLHIIWSMLNEHMPKNMTIVHRHTSKNLATQKCFMRMLSVR